MCGSGTLGHHGAGLGSVGRPQLIPPEPAPARAPSPSDAHPQHLPQGWLVPDPLHLWEKTSCCQMGAQDSEVSLHHAGPATHQAPSQKGWQARATGLCREGADRLWPEAAQAAVTPAQRALSVVTRDRGGGRAELTSVAAMLEEARSRLSVTRGAQVPVPTEASQPRDEVRAAVAPSAER